MALLGNWEQGLSKLIARAHEIASKQTHEKLTTRARDVIASQMKREFRTGVGPNAVPWPKPKDGGTPMVRTGALRSSGYALVADPITVRFGFGKGYAGILQRGTKRTSSRALVPPDPPSAGPVWGPRILGSLRQLLGKLLKGAK